MGKKTERHVWDWARLPDVAASFDRLPAPDERVRPVMSEGLHPSLPDGHMRILSCALEDPHAPAACGACIVACLHIISTGPEETLNDQILRYNYHDLLDRCMRFLACPRTLEQYEATDSLLSRCACLEDNSPLLEQLVPRHYADVAPQRVRARRATKAATPKGKRHKSLPEDCEDVDEDEVLYEDARVRGELGNFIDRVHAFGAMSGRASYNLTDVLSRVANCIWTAVQPMHDRDDLHKFRDDTARRRAMWPGSATNLLPFGPQETMRALGFAADRTLSWAIMGIAGVILDIVSGPTLAGFLDSEHFSGAFVRVGASGIARMRTLVTQSLREADVSESATELLVDFTRLALLSQAVADTSPQNLRRLNALSLAQSGIADALHLCNHVLSVWSMYSIALIPEAPPTVQEIARRTSQYFLRLGASLYHSLGLADGAPPQAPPPWLALSMSPDRAQRRSATKFHRAACMRAFGTPMQALECHFTIAQVARELRGTRETRAGAAFEVFFKLCWRRHCWARGCATSRALGAERFKRCAGCWHVKYCSRECQKAAWRDEHKDVCAVMHRIADALAVPKEPLEPEYVETFRKSCASKWDAVADDLERLTKHFKPLLEVV